MDQLLTVEQVAALFHVVPKTVNAWVRKGLLVSTELGGVRRFRPADIEAAAIAARRLPQQEGPADGRLAPVEIGRGQGWNESACRPYGMTMAAWRALGLTKADWLARQEASASDGRRRRRGRRAS